MIATGNAGPAKPGGGAQSSAAAAVAASPSPAAVPDAQPPKQPAAATSVQQPQQQLEPPQVPAKPAAVPASAVPASAPASAANGEAAPAAPTAASMPAVASSAARPSVAPEASPSAAADGGSSAGGNAGAAAAAAASAIGGSGGSGIGGHQPKDKERAAKTRRAAAGSEAVRDQIRKMVVGGPLVAEDKSRGIDAVSDSEDDETELAAMERDVGRLDVSGRSATAKPPEVAAVILEALQRNFVFKGIPDNLLLETVQRMFCVTFPAGATIIQQNSLPCAEDCMYFLQSGSAEVVIMGGLDASAKHGAEEAMRVEGNAVRIPQHPGWVFGDVALLFNSPRTASVVAASDVVLWAMDRATFLRFVMRHAQGARTLRFVRKVPLLKGLSDNDLLRVAGRMPERIYADAEALIRYGERGDEMYLIRYGKVRVLVPDAKGGRIEVAVLGRGQFVGERSVINDKLRSADCVAQGRVQVVVLRKRDFLDLDNPLLAWMLDYDAVSAVLKALPAFKKLKQEQMEHIFDRFEARQELYQGDTIVNQGEPIEKIFVVKMGEVQLLAPDGSTVTDTAFVREAGGFTFFGDACLDAITRSAYTVRVASEIAHVLSLPRRQLDGFLGAVGSGLASRGQVLAALRQCRSLQALREEDLAAIVDAGDPIRYSPGEVIAIAQPTAPATAFYLVRTGEVLLLPTSVQLPSNITEVDVHQAEQLAAGRLLAGGLYNEAVLCAPAAPLQAHLVARSPGTVVICFELASITRALGAPGGLLHRGAQQQQQQQRTAAEQQHALLQQQVAMQQQQQQRMAGLVQLQLQQQQMLALQQQQQMQAAGGLRAVLPGQAMPTAVAGLDSRGTHIDFADLELRRVIGTGQFGLVRVVRHVKTDEVFALKVMHKAPLVEAKQIEHVVNERAILGELQHPFLVGLVGAFQDATSLYLLQEWVPGGELFHHLDIEGSFSDATACFYAANVLLAMECLHARGIVYRDLKPENLLLDTQGYIKMADFGFAKKIGSERTFTICGTPDYQAPEVIMRRGTTRAADYWALGVLVFEMLVGDPPFKSLTGDPWDTFRRTLSGRFYVPHFITDAAADLIFKLLQVNPEKRLGCGPGGIAEIKAHRWFSRINWDALAAKQLPAPIQPRLKSLLDTSNFDNFDDAESDGQMKGHMGGLAAAGAAGAAGGDKGVVVWDTWQWIGGGTQGAGGMW
uniref:cGMP-dependent protein kinase n=1 Tax=Tetradesmus obliquus TaxID=3088 RepID=A0A383VZL0_TETOB